MSKICCFIPCWVWFLLFVILVDPWLDGKADMHIDLSCPCFGGSSGRSEVGGVVKFKKTYRYIMIKTIGPLPVLVVSLTSLQNKAQLCCSMWNRPWGQYLGNCLKTDPRHAMRLVEITHFAWCIMEHNGRQSLLVVCIYVGCVWGWLGEPLS